MIKRFNVSKPIKYIKNGEEKTKWENVGTMTVFTKDDGSKSTLLEIPAIGLEARVFEQKNDSVNNTTEDINVDDIPF